MPRGPAPSKNKRRRNAPTIPTTELDVAGRKGRPPKIPEGYQLGKVGRAWWKWAWATPQALAWDRGALYVIARRAQLEDDLDAISLNDELEITDLLAGADEEAIERVAHALDTLKRAATGKLAIEKEMRELDKVLGLTPAAMVALRWEIVKPKADEDAKPAKAAASKSSDRRARLTVVA